ncbi:MAG: tetratricopeptide repeat protein [Planctomycetota bacterium]
MPLDEAKEFFEKRVSSNTEPQDFLALGSIMIAIGEHEKGIADLKKALELATDARGYLEPLGFAQLATNDEPSAIETFSKALLNETESVPALMGRGLAYYQVGQLENSRLDLERAIALEPKHAFPRKYLGALLHDMGTLERAEEHLDAAAKIDGYDAFTRKALGRLYYDMGKYSEALREFAIAVKLAPKDVESITGRGVIRHSIGTNLDGAEADFKLAIQLSDDSENPGYLWSNLGQVQMEVGKFADAFNSLTKAIKVDPTFMEARSHRAQLLATQLPNDLKRIEQAKGDVQIVFQSPGPRTFWDYRALAAVNAALGDYERAVKYQGHAEKALRKSGPKRFQAPASQTMSEFLSFIEDHSAAERNH